MNTQPTPISDRIVSQFRKGEATSDGLILTMVELELKLAAICRERDELKRWTSVNGVIDLQRERDEAREALRTGGMLNIIDRAAHERATAIRQRDEAREEMIRWQSIAEGRGRTDECNDSDTPRTDHVVKKSDQKDAEMAFAIMTDHADCLERELAAVTAQRDEAREVLKMTQEAWVKAKAERVEALRQRDEAREENGTWKQIASARLSKIAEVTTQRDRLAEALQKLRNNESMSLGGAAYEIVEQALQSLTPTQTEPK